MFNRDHHKRVATILQSLDAELLAKHHCLFGGGTAIVLAREEYRESVDIDFIISDRAGYQELRTLLTGQGLASIVRPGMQLSSLREIRADQYGIRTMLRADDVQIKFEIVLEARIELEAPIADQRICGVSVLTPIDMAATKLLANSDRWSDDSVNSRDLIDLAMVDLTKDELKVALGKAKGAYGASVERDLAKAIESLSQRKGRLEQCMKALKIDTLPKARLLQKIRDLQ